MAQVIAYPTDDDDGDGIPDHLDNDDDNDGIPDDQDNDDDGDGIPDSDEGERNSCTTFTKEMFPPKLFPCFFTKI